MYGCPPPALRRLVTAERYPHLAVVVASGAHLGSDAPRADDGDADFCLGRILDGVAAYVEARRAP